MDVGVTERMLLDNIGITRTDCLAVISDVKKSLGALHHENECQRSRSMKAWQTEELQWKRHVSDKDSIIQALTADQAQCAAMAERWRAKHDLQVCPEPCHE